ncbi:MAG: hypothetical protein WC227_04505 [Patescibacteria group bacterium]
MSINGTDASKKITLVSSSPGTRWNIDPQATKSVSWVTVSDSTSTNAINATNSTEGTPSSTTNWLLLTDHTLSYSAVANGSIVGTNPQTVADGADGTEVVATPAANYHWVSWSDTYPTAARTDLNVTGDITVSASFAIDTFTLTYSAGANGSIVGVSPQTVNYGANGSEVTATPAANYHFTSWSDGILTAARTDTNITANKSVTASFAIDTHTLTYSSGANGSIVGTSPQTVNHGADGSEVVATPAANYHFTSWSDGVLTAARTDTNVVANISVTASFAIDTFTLTYSAGANGSIVGDSPQTVNYGANGSEVTATPAANYHFTSWSDGVLTAARTDTNITANKSVTASFAIDTYTLAYSAGANGSITGTTPQTVNHGSDGSQVTATADANYHFTSWSDGVLTAARTETNVTADKSVTASFAINTHTLSYSASANGSITGVSPQTVNHGASGSQVTAAPAANYHFVEWSDNHSTVASRTDSNVTADISSTASFAIDTHNITASTDANGNISPLGITAVDYGTDQDITFTSDPGYHISTLLVDGVPQSTLTSPYTFVGVTENHTISITTAADNTCVWVGLGADSNWSTSLNWSGNEIPVSTCDVIFNSSSSTASTLDAGFTNHIKSLSIISGYTNTVTLANDLQNDGDLNLAAGTLKANNYTLNIAGDWDNTGGTFVEDTSTVNFNGSVAASVSANGGEFYRVTFAGVSAISTPSVWVANYNTNNVSKINSSNGSKTGDYSTGSYSYGSAIDTSGFAWVTNMGSDTVSKINVSTGAKITDYATGSIPKGVAIDASGFVWVANFGGGTVSKINPSTGVKTNYTTGSGSTGVAIDASGFVWVTNYSGTGSVSKINASTGSKVADYAVGTNPTGVAIDASGFVWVVNTGSNNISKINALTGVKVADYATGLSPAGVAVDTNGFVWISNGGANTISKMNPSTGSKTDYATGSSPAGVAVDSSGFIWIANTSGNTISKMNSSTGSKTDYSVGTSPYSFGDMTGFALQQFVLGGTNSSSASYTLSSGLTMTDELTISSGIVSAGANTISAGKFIQSGGYFTAPSTTMSVSGDFQRSGGVFVRNLGTVSLAGVASSTQVVSGSTTFNNLSATTTSARTIQFAADSSQAVLGTWTATGAAAQLLSLALKTGDSGVWNINPTAWSVDYVNVSNSTNFASTPISPTHYDSASLTANNTNWFSLSLVGHTITSSVVGSNGTISPSGATSVADGSNQTYTITPGTGYHISDIKIDGISLTGTLASTYTFSNVTAEHTIAVTFAANDVCVWDGGADDENWSSASNWSNDTTPFATCDVIFNSTSRKNSIIDTIFSSHIKSLAVNTGYTGIISASNDLANDGDFVLSSGTFSAGSKTINIAGSLSLAPSSTAVFEKGSSTINFNPIATGKTITTSGQQLGNLTFNGVDANLTGVAITSNNNIGLLRKGIIVAGWTLQDNLSAASVAVVSGTLVDAGKSVTVAGSINIPYKIGLLASTGLWTQSASGNISNGDMRNTFGSLTIAGAGVTTNMIGAVKVGLNEGSAGALTMGPGTLNGNNNSLIEYMPRNDGLGLDNLIVGSKLSTFTMYPLGNILQKAISLPNNFGNIQIQKNPSTKFTATGDFNFGNNNLTVNNDSTIRNTGYLDMGQYNLTCNNLTIGSNFGSVANPSYYQIAGGLKISSGSINVGGNLAAAHPLNFGDTLDLGSGTLNFSGSSFNTNYLNFTAGTSTVNFTSATGSTQAIYSSATFNNLSIATTSARIIKFAAGTTQTVLGTWTATGAPDQLLTMALKAGDTGLWSVNPAAWNVDYVNVSNSNNLASSKINPAHYVDGGGNINWFDPAVAPIPDEPGTDLGTIVDDVIDTVTTAIDVITDAITNFITNIVETLAQSVIGLFVQNAVENISAAIAATATAIRNVLSKIGLTPEVASSVATAVTAVSIAAAAIAAAPMAASGSLFNLGEIFHSIWQPIANFVTRKRRRNWGRVIEEGTGVPIATAKINLVKLYRESREVMYESQKVVASTYTDKSGQYGFVVEPGKYKLEVVKDKFNVVDTNSFLDFYHPNTLFEVRDYKQGLVIKDITMATGAKNMAKNFKFTHLLQAIQKISAYVSIGFLIFGTASIIPVVTEKFSLINLGIVALYILFWVMNVKNILKKSPWGIVISKEDHMGIPLVLVRIINKKTGQLVGTTISNEKGRFSTFISKGDYEIRASKGGYVLEKPIVYKVGGEKNVLNKTIEMVPE